MASMSETLTTKRGGIPTWGWFLGGTGVLVLFMFLRARSQAASQSASQPAALQTNLLSPDAAAALAQGAAPMGYSGGNIYNNIAMSGNTPQTPAAPASTGIAPDIGSTSYFAYRYGTGDTWQSIANQFGVGVDSLKALNGNPTSRGSWGPIDTTQALGPGSVVIVPWLNQTQQGYNSIRTIEGLQPVNPT